MDACTAQAKEHGYVNTFFGRKLRVEHDRPYSATDYCIQGSAAALFKHAQVAVDKYFQSTYGDENARILLPVHDELVMEIKREYLGDLKSIMPVINRLMINFPQITVPIKVEFNLSTYTWDAKKEITYEVRTK
jgi:DNA polymerase I-like protein with 3'-5' exonuclease and polymerase domains